MGRLLLAVLLVAAPKELLDSGVSESLLSKHALEVVHSGLEAAPLEASAYSAKPLKVLSAKNRARVVLGALKVTRAFLATAEAHERFGEVLVGAAPQGPKEQLAESEETLAQLRAESAKTIAEAASDQRGELRRSYTKLTNALEAKVAEAKAKLPDAQKEFQPEYDAWASRRHEAGQGLEARLVPVLVAFLEGTKEMHFEAKLKADGEFVEAALEAKPRWWKVCWRAGQEPVEAARSFATSWVAELNASQRPQENGSK